MALGTCPGLWDHRSSPAKPLGRLTLPWRSLAWAACSAPGRGVDSVVFEASEGTSLLLFLLY